VILEITGKCSNKTRTGVHFKPESVFILDRNRCSDWAGIRSSSTALRRPPLPYALRVLTS